MTKPQTSGEERKAAIIAAAIKVIARTSFEGCSTISIAKEASVTEYPLFYHFKTKKYLQLAVMDTVSKKFMSIIDMIHNLPSITLVEMRVIGKQLQRDLSKNPDYVTVLLKAGAMEDTEIREKTWAVYQAFQKALKISLDKMASERNVNIDEHFNTEAWALLFWTSMLSVITQLGKLDAIPEEQIDWMIALMDKRLHAIIENPNPLPGSKEDELKSTFHNTGIQRYNRDTRPNGMVSKSNPMVKQRMRANERRVSIIEAAITVIARTSFERCTTALIAKEAGVTEPIIYRHFKSMKDLQITVLDSILKDMLAFADKTVRELPSLTMRQLRDYGEQYRCWISKNPGQITVLLKGFALEDEDAREKMWEIIQSIHMGMKKLLDKLPANGNTRPDAMINILAWVMVSCVSVTPAMNLLGKLDAIPEDLFDARLSFIEDILNGKLESPLGMRIDGPSIN